MGCRYMVPQSCFIIKIFLLKPGSAPTILTLGMILLKQAKVKEKTGKPMFTIEVTDDLPFPYDYPARFRFL